MGFATLTLTMTAVAATAVSPSVPVRAFDDVIVVETVKAAAEKLSGSHTGSTGSIADSPSISDLWDVILGRGDDELMGVLSRLRDLRDGWMGQGTLAPSLASINHAHQAALDVPTNARVSAGGDGSIIIEWETADIEHIVSIEGDETILIIDETPDGNLLREDTIPYTHVALAAALRA